MICYYNRDGTIIEIRKGETYQGLLSTQKLQFVAPIFSGNSVAVAFVLPNGVRTRKYIMTLSTELGLDGVQDKNGNRFYIWQMDFPARVTELTGNVTCQFFITTADGKKEAFQPVTFVMQSGVPPIIPTPESLEDILTYIAQIKTEIQNAVENVRNIQEYAEEWVRRLDEKVVFVDELPERGQDGYMYATPAENALFSLWKWENEKWNKIGVTEFTSLGTKMLPLYLRTEDWHDNTLIIETDEVPPNAILQMFPTKNSSLVWLDADITVVADTTKIIFTAVNQPQVDISLFLAIYKEPPQIDLVDKYVIFGESLPEKGQNGYLYAVPTENAFFDLFKWENGQWVKIGTTEFTSLGSKVLTLYLHAYDWHDGVLAIETDEVPPNAIIQTYPTHDSILPFYDADITVVADTTQIRFSAKKQPIEDISLYFIIYKEPPQIDVVNKYIQFLDKLPEKGDDKLLYAIVNSKGLVDLYKWQNDKFVPLGESDIRNFGTLYIEFVLDKLKWIGNEQRIENPKIFDYNVSEIYPFDNSAEGYLNAKITADVQTGAIIFHAETVPSEDIKIIVKVTTEASNSGTGGFFAFEVVDGNLILHNQSETDFRIDENGNLVFDIN